MRNESGPVIPYEEFCSLSFKEILREKYHISLLLGHLVHSPPHHSHFNKKNLFLSTSQVVPQNI